MKQTPLKRAREDDSESEESLSVLPEDLVEMKPRKKRVCVHVYKNNSAK